MGSGKRLLMIGRNQFNYGELSPSQQSVIEGIIDSIAKICQHNESKNENEIVEEDINRYENTFKNMNRPTQIFSILGDRGQGKTSTLISLCEILLEGKYIKTNDTNKTTINIDKSIKCLVAPVLEPEFLLSDESTFPAIIYNLSRLLAKDGISFSKRGFEQYDKMKFEKDLQKFLNEYLSQSPGIGKELIVDLSINFETYVSRVMNSNTSYLALSAQLSEWVNSLLRSTGKNILIFPIDDIDICSENTENLLNLVRLYLSHPKIAVILTAHYDTISRTMLNRRLSQIPSFFTSSIAIASSDKPERFGGKNWEQNLILEYDVEKDYVSNFLYKVLPKTRQFKITGLEASKRLIFPFYAESKKDDNGSSNVNCITLLRVFKEIPLLKDFNDDCNRLKEYCNKSPDFFTNEVRKERNWLENFCKLYPEMFSPTLRVLLNQVIYFQDICEDYITRLKKLVNPNIHDVKKEEDKFMKQFLMGLVFNPEIENDMDAFFCEATQSNAFDAESFREFLKMLTNLKQQTIKIREKTGDEVIIKEKENIAPFGFLFKYSPRSKSSISNKPEDNLSEPSSAFVNFVIEYAISIGNELSLWNILKDWKISVELNKAIEIREIKLLEYIEEKNKKPETITISASSEIIDIIEENLLKSINLSNNGEKTYTMHLLDNYLSPPRFLHTLKDASTYSYYAYHERYEENSDIIVKNLNDTFDEIYKNNNYNRDDDQERNFAYKVLGLISYRAYCEIYGLCKVFFKDDWNVRENVSFSEDISWYLYDQEAIGPMITALLNGHYKDYDGKLIPEEPVREIEDRFLALLYIASLPIAPLLTNWKQSKYDETNDDYNNAESLINTIKKLLNEIEEKKYKIRWISSIDIDKWEINLNTDDEFVKRHENVLKYNLTNQAEQVKKLYFLLNKITAEQVKHGTADQVPSAWEKFINKIIIETKLEGSNNSKDSNTPNNSTP